MLNELQRLHGEIRANLDRMDELTAAKEPPMDRLPALRLALTRASRARFTLLDRLYPDLLASAGAADRAALDALRVEGQASRLHSAHHIGAWTLAEIVSRWPDYRAAARQMCNAMRVRIAREQRLIYPLLGDGGARGVRAA